MIVNETRKVAKNTVFSALSLGMRLVTNAFLMLFIARRLGVDGFGQFAFAIAFAQLFSMFADFGLDTLVIKEIAQNPREISKFANNVLSLKAVLSIAVVVLSVVVINLLRYSMDVKLLVYIAILSAVVYEFVIYISSLLRSVERMKDESVISFGYNMILVIGVFSVLFLLGSPIYIMLTYLAVRIFALMWARTVFSKAVYPIRFSYDLKFWKWLSKETVPYGLFGFASIIYFQTDTILLSYFKGDKAVGLYQVAVSTILAVMYFSEMMVNSFLPVLSRYYSLSKGMFLSGVRNFVYILSFVAIPATIFTFVLAPKIIILLYGEQFAPSGMILRAVSLLILLRFSVVAYGMILTVSGNQKLRTRAVIETVVINVLLDLILIRKYGINGVISATIISTILLNARYAMGAYRITGSLLLDRDILTISVVAIMLGIFSYYFSAVNLIVLFAMYSILYLVILYAIPNSKFRILLDKLKKHEL